MSASAIACAHRPCPELPASATLGPIQLVLNVIGFLMRSVSDSSRLSQAARVVDTRPASRPSA